MRRGSIDCEVVAVCRGETHSFSKPAVDAICLVEGLGVEGDAHKGITVKHRSRVKKDPSQPNLRQVHLIHSELHDELAEKGFHILPGNMGENITTRGIDLLGLCQGARLMLGDEAVVEITGLRNPCSQLDNYLPGLTRAVLDRDGEGNLIRKAGVMGIVITGGMVRARDRIRIEWPNGERVPLEVV